MLLRNALLIGTGGCGVRLVDHVSRAYELSSNVLILDSDIKELNDKSKNLDPRNHILYWPNIYQGFFNEHLRHYSVEHDFAHVAGEVLDKVSNYEAVYIYTGLAGVAGSTLSTKIADMVYKIGKPVVSFAVMPFEFERMERQVLANACAERLRQVSAINITVCNSIMQGNKDLSINEAFVSIAEFAANITRESSNFIEFRIRSPIL